MRNIAIIGAGAAGMTAAYFALQNGADVTLFEKNRQPGRKICITGKGRCNLTNDIDARDFLTHVVNGSKFLYSALYRFPPKETMAWFESLGLKLKVERGNRVFPISERASDVRDVLLGALKPSSSFSLSNEEVRSIERNGEGFFVHTKAKGGPFDAVIVATGGLSYPLTGSTGDGYRFARNFGHSVVPASASLVRVICETEICSEAQGLSLKNVRLSLFEEGKKKPLYSEQGEMLFTDDGISGPLVLSASAHLCRVTEKTHLEIDFKPALSFEELDARLLRDFAANTNRYFRNSLDDLLPAAMRPIFVRLSEIDPERRVHQITREERGRLVQLFKAFRLESPRCGPIEEAVVTAGGVALSEIDPRSMESKICPNLYFAGEVLDVDAYTGGYNLQIAFSTGKLAGESAALMSENL